MELGACSSPKQPQPLPLEQRAGEEARAPLPDSPRPHHPRRVGRRVSPLSFSQSSFRSQAGGQCVAAACLNPQLAAKQRALKRSEGTFRLASCRPVASGRGQSGLSHAAPRVEGLRGGAPCALPLLRAFLRLAPPLRLCWGPGPPGRFALAWKARPGCLVFLPGETVGRDSCGQTCIFEGALAAGWRTAGEERAGGGGPPGRAGDLRPGEASWTRG